MEELIEFINKIPISEELLLKSGIVLLKIEDIALIKKNEENFKLRVKINVEHEVFYDKIYTGPYKDVRSELREMFMVLSFLKVN